MSFHDDDYNSGVYGDDNYEYGSDLSYLNDLDDDDDDFMDDIPVDDSAGAANDVDDEEEEE